jgi:Ca2+/Na+ antiporter
LFKSLALFVVGLLQFVGTLDMHVQMFVMSLILPLALVTAYVAVSFLMNHPIGLVVVAVVLLCIIAKHFMTNVSQKREDSDKKELIVMPWSVAGADTLHTTEAPVEADGLVTAVDARDDDVTMGSLNTSMMVPLPAGTDLSHGPDIFANVIDNGGGLEQRLIMRDLTAIHTGDDVNRSSNDEGDKCSDVSDDTDNDWESFVAKIVGYEKNSNSSRFDIDDGIVSSQCR